MSVAYRSVAQGPTKTIVIAPPARWFALILTIPFLLTFNRSFMSLVAPIPVLQGDGFCGNASPNFGEYMAALGWAEEVREILALLALVAVVVALTTLVLPKTIVVVDRAAQIVSVRTRRGQQALAFGDRPVLVQRDGAWFLHAGALAPIRIAWRGASRAAIAELRAALAAVRP